MIRRITILALLLLISAEVMAQKDSILVVGRDTVAYRYTPIETASVKSQKSREGWSKFVQYIADSATDQSFQKKVDMTFVPALYYAPSTSAGLAVMASGMYRIDKTNRSIPASDFSVYATASLTGFYRVGVKGNNIFRNDHRRIIYNAEFYSQPTSFWGVGYDAAMTNSPLRYLASRTIVDVHFLQTVAKGLFVGAGADFNYHFGGFGGKRNFVAESDFLARLGGERANYNATGISLYVEYDTRDVISAPQRGVYIAVQGKVRPKGMNSVGRTLWSGRLVVDYYQRLWRGAVLALDLHGEFNSRHTPWTLYALLGSNYRMRGYYEGRFSDLNMVTFQAELRQKVWHRLGVVVWGGAGNVFHSLDSYSWQQTLPNYGVGVRWELKKGINARIDYGFGGVVNGRLINGLVLSINEAF